MDKNIFDLNEIIHIEDIPKKTNFWLVRTKGGLFYEEFKDKRFIALGWNDIDKNKIDKLNKEKDVGIKAYKLKKEILIENIEKFWGVKKATASQILNKSERLIYEMKENDIVMIPNKSSKEIIFAKVKEYYENDISIDKELEIVKRIESGNFDYLIEKCPYKKCRRIEILKTVSGNRIHPKLYKALLSRHGISDIKEYSEAVLSTIYPIYCWENRINLVMEIQKRGRIDAYEFGKLAYNIANIVRENDINNNIKITTRQNFNSPGLMEFMLEIANKGVDILGNIPAISILTIIVLAICGGEYKGKKINSIVDKILNWKKENINIKKGKIELGREKIVTDMMKNKYDQEVIETKIKQEKLKQEELKTQLLNKKLETSNSIENVTSSSNELMINTDELIDVLNLPGSNEC